MKQRTLISTLFIAGALAAPIAFAQDATSATDASQQTPPVSVQAAAAAKQSTSADAVATDAAASAEGKTSGDAGLATSASTTSAYDSATPTDQDKQDKDESQQQP